jgi:hypothetical protein
VFSEMMTHLPNSPSHGPCTVGAVALARAAALARLCLQSYLKYLELIFLNFFSSSYSFMYVHYEQEKKIQKK